MDHIRTALRNSLFKYIPCLPSRPRDHYSGIHHMAEIMTQLQKRRWRFYKECVKAWRERSLRSETRSPEQRSMIPKSHKISTNVGLRNSEEELETFLKASIIIQSWVRMYIQRKKFLGTKKKIIHIQANIRGWRQRRSAVSIAVQNYFKVLKACNQVTHETFENIFPEVESFKKIGSGKFGYCYMLVKNVGKASIFKLIPVQILPQSNSETMTSIKAGLVEIVTSYAVNTLRQKKLTSSFIYMKNSWVVRGIPPRFIQNANNNEKYSRNRHKSKEVAKFDYTSNKFYLVMELEDGGRPVKDVPNISEAQLVSIMSQLCCGIKVAEDNLEFEHGDLHLENVLVRQTKKSKIEYLIHGKKIKVLTYGLKIKIIDFSLSRVKYGDEIMCNVFGLMKDSQSRECCLLNNIYQIDSFGHALMTKKFGNYEAIEGQPPKSSLDFQWGGEILVHKDILEYYLNCLKPLSKSFRNPSTNLASRLFRIIFKKQKQY